MKYTKCFFLCCLLSCLMSYAQDSPQTLRIMTYNIQHGAGQDDVIDLDRQAAVIADAEPDVVGLQEVDSCVKRSNRVHQAAVLGKSLGMYSTFGPAIPLTGGKYGVAILSKEKPLSHRVISLPGSEKRALLVCEFQEYVFACTHLALEEENRMTSLDIILEEAARWNKPFFICGDWNDEPSSTFITNVKKSFTILNSTTSSISNYTFPAGTPKKTIDYIAFRKGSSCYARKRQVINAPDASDHRPVLVEVRYDTATPLLPVPQVVNGTSTIYDLSGRCLNSKFKIQNSKLGAPEAQRSKVQSSDFSPSPIGEGRGEAFHSSFKSGLYIVNGKKVLIR